MPNIRDVGRDLNVSLSSIPVSKWTRASSAPVGDDSDKGSKKTSFGIKIPATVDERRLASPKSDKGKADISAFQDEIDRLDDGLSGDQDKLALAAKLVNDQIGDESTLGDTAYRNAVQATYDDMNPSLSYVTVSGDWGEPVRQLNDAINDVTYGLGSGLDWLWDNTVAAGLGGIADFTGLGDGESVKEQVADFMTPEGGSIAADMLIDLGLGLIPGVGPWLAVGKGLVHKVVRHLFRDRWIELYVALDDPVVLVHRDGEERRAHLGVRFDRGARVGDGSLLGPAVLAPWKRVVVCGDDVGEQVHGEVQLIVAEQADPSKDEGKHYPDG